MTRHNKPISWMIAGVVMLSGAIAHAQGKTKPKSPKQQTCMPGIQISCPCPGGAPPGVQVCDEDGARYLECECTVPPAATVATPAPAASSSPMPPANPELLYRRRSRGLMVSGIVLLPMSVAATGIGAAVYVIDTSAYRSGAGGIITMGIGSAVTIFSIVALAVGAPRVLIAPSKPASSWLTIEPTADGLRFAF